MKEWRLYEKVLWAKAIPPSSAQMASSLKLFFAICFCMETKNCKTDKNGEILRIFQMFPAVSCYQRSADLFGHMRSREGFCSVRKLLPLYNGSVFVYSQEYLDFSFFISFIFTKICWIHKHPPDPMGYFPPMVPQRRRSCSTTTKIWSND